MADDKPNDESAPDPWADMLSDDADGPAPEFSFSFDETIETEAAATDVPAAASAADEPGDDDVGAWLDAGDLDGGDAGADADPATADAGSSSSSLEIGTGRSGLVESSEAWEDVGPADDQPSAASGGSGDSFSFADAPSVEAVAGTVAAGAGAAVAASKPAKPAKAAKSGIGQMIGVVLGGALAFPLVFGILVGLMWAGVNVPVGRSIGRALPESMAFLVPEKYRSGYRKAAANLPRVARRDDAPSGDDVPAGEEGGTAAAEPFGDGSPDDLAASTPMPDPTGEPVVDETPVVPPGDGETLEDSPAAPTQPGPPSPAVAELAAAEARRAAAEAERVAAEAAAAAARAERQPLDAAVAEALTAVAALEEVADAEDPTRKKLLVDWYKALAKVGAELALLERITADAGRPLAEAPESIAGLHGRLGRHRDDLVRLARNWLDFTKRPSDGVVLPVTFQSSRKIGPYWSSKVSLPLAKEGVREIVVLSRTEPAAVAGDEVLLTGMLFDGGVVWAADVRPMAAGGGGY